MHEPPLQSQREPHASETASEAAHEELQYIARQGPEETLAIPGLTLPPKGTQLQHKAC